MKDAEWMKFLLELMGANPTDEEAMRLSQALWKEKDEEKGLRLLSQQEFGKHDEQDTDG